MGDTGPTQYIVSINGLIRSFAKTTGEFDSALNLSPEQFFRPVISENARFSDPRIRYDRMTDRWFVTGINITNDPFGVGNIIIAMSDTGIITPCTLWSYFEIIDAPPVLTDQPTLGIDANALYLGAEIFPEGEFGVRFPRFYVVNKAGLIGGAPTSLVLGTDYFEFNVPNPINKFVIGTCPGVVNFDNDTIPTATVGYFVGIESDQTNNFQSKIVVYQVINPGTLAPTLAGPFYPAVETFFNAQISVIPKDNIKPIQAMQGGSKIISAVMRDGKLYLSHTVQCDLLGSSANLDTVDRLGARWYEISNPDTTLTVDQFGTLFDSTTPPVIPYPAPTPFNPDASQYFYPSIMVSGQGHLALGCTLASTTTYLSAVTTGRLVTDPVNTLRLPPVIYGNSTTAFNTCERENVPTARWGDYSYVSLDPSDDMTLWPIQQWCNDTTSFGCQVVQLLAPPPATPISALPAAVASGLGSVLVTITGSSVSGSGFYNFNPSGLLNYATPAAFWVNQIGASVTGGVVVNNVTYVDPTTVILDLDTTGASLGAQDVTITNPDKQQATGVGILTIV